jgi:hypothetical protein
LKRITMNITFEPSWRVQNENRKIFIGQLGGQLGKFEVLKAPNIIPGIQKYQVPGKARISPPAGAAEQRKIAQKKSGDQKHDLNNMDDQ